MADSVTIDIVGAGSFSVDMRAWMTRLRRDVSADAQIAAEALVQNMRMDYPQGPTGNLRKGVKLWGKSEVGMTTIYRIRSTARHGSIYEYGTKTRTTKRAATVPITGGGFRRVRNRGAMPAFGKFVNEAKRRRAWFIERVKHLLGTAVPELGGGSPNVTES